MPCGREWWPSSRFDAEDFIVAFFSQWIREAAGHTWDFGRCPIGDPDEARRLLFAPGILERVLEQFQYSGGYARKFRECFLRWERAYRFQHQEIERVLARPQEVHMSKPPLTLRQEVNRVMEIVDQIEQLSPPSQAYIMVLLERQPGSATEPLPATTKRVKKTRARMAHVDRSDNGIPDTTEDLDEAAANAQNVGRRVVRFAPKACCGSKGPRHFATCPTK